MSAPLENPYVGPRTFTRAEADLFFGREREARQLLSRVISERLVLFYAQSGAGKSSLLNTCLIPDLEDADFTVLPVGRVSGELSPGIGDIDNIFAFNLMRSLERGDSDPRRLAHLPLRDFLARLTLNVEGTSWYYDNDLLVPPVDDEPDMPYVLVIDQFEEIISTHLEHWAQREEFFRQLDQAMRADPQLWVVLTLREDYVAAIEPYATLLADRLRARFYMQRMEVDAALEAITKPADLGGRPFAPGVAETLVDNLRQVQVAGQTETYPGQYVEPVQLQVVCYKLWESLTEQPAGPITVIDLQAAGDVDTALAEFYEQALQATAAQTRVPEVTLRRWFDQQLITEVGSRGTVYQGDEKTGGLPNPAVDMLANQYLLRAELRSGGTWYELVHDRFVDPIVQANRLWYERRRQRNPLAQATQIWLDNDRAPGKLLRGTPLKEARAYAAAHPEDTTAEELEFLEQSSRRLNPLATATQLWLEDGRNPDLLLQGRQLAEAKTYAAGNQNDLTAEELEFLETSQRQAQFEQDQAELAARRRRYAVVSASVAIMVLIILLIWAVQNAANARRAEATALTDRAAAEAAKETAEISEANAEAASTDALVQRETAEARRVAAITAQANTQLEAERAKTAQAEAVAERDKAQTAEAQAKGLADSLAALLPTETATASPTPRPTVTAAASTIDTVTPSQTASSATPSRTPTASATPDRAATVQVAQTRLAEVRASETAAALPNYPPAARLVFTSNRNSVDKTERHLFIMNADGSNQRQLTRDIATEPNYSIAAGRIIFSKPQFGGIVSLFTIRPDGANEQGIDEQFWDNWEPAFAPDGRRIAFTSSRENRDWEIYTRNLDGSVLLWNGCGPTVPAEFPELLKWAPAWSPDGEKIAFVVSTERSQYAGEADIWVMDAEGANCQPLTDTPGVIDKYPDWSPDGRQIVFVSNRNGSFELFTMDANGQNQRRISTPATFPKSINYPAWSADGNWFTFSASVTARDVTPDDIFVLRIDGQHLTNLTNGTPGENENWYSDWIDE